MSTFSNVTIDRVRDYWNSRPCNIRHSPKPVGTKEYFDEVEARKYLVEPHIPGFADFPRWEGKRVLEIGCGIGTDTTNFARHGATVTAIDLSDQSLEVARQRIEVFGLQDRVTFYHGDAEKLSEVIPPEPYDLVYSFGVIHHSPHPDKVFEQITKFIHPDSTLKVMMYHKFSWKVFGIVLKYGWGAFWRTAELVANHSEAQTGCPVTYIYTPEELRSLIEPYGFEEESHFIDHIFPYSIPEYKNYEYVKIWPIRMMPAPMFRWLETTLGWHLCMTLKAKG